MIFTYSKSSAKRPYMFLCMIMIVGGLLFTPNVTNNNDRVIASHYLESTGRRALQRQTVTRDMTQDLREARFVLDKQAFEQSQRTLRNTVDNMVNFVNSGIDGNPAYIQNLGQYVTDSVDREVQFFIQNLSSSIGNSPFLADVQGALQEVHSRNMRGEISGYTGVANTEAFFAGDFGQGGGWEGFEQMISNPAGNLPLGTMLSSEIAQRRTAQATAFEEVTKANWGDGFRSLEQCDGNGRNCTITTPGTVVADQLNQALGSSFDSLVAANSMDQVIEDTFARLSQEALAGANGLLGINLDAGAIFNTILDRILNNGSNDGGPVTTEERAAAVETANRFLVTTLETAADEEEDFLSFVEDVIADAEDGSITLSEEEETNLLQRANQSQLNLIELNDLIIRNEQRAEAADGNRSEQDIIEEVQSEYAELRNELNNAADIALLQNQLGLD